jgi:hypothetical protein
MKEHFGSKKQLAERLSELLESAQGESKPEFCARLQRVANRKLIHLFELGERLRSLGGKEQVIERIATLKQQLKDHPYRDKLKTYSPGRLLDLLGQLERRARDGSRPASGRKKKTA